MRGFAFYTRLAWQGITKNARVYLPYIFTCVGMVMMYYIVGALEDSSVVAEMRGGDTVQQILSLGELVVGFFSLLFLLYTNSFLLRRRKKEFGLYNMLGMSKRNLAWVLLIENLLVAALSLAGGLGLGVVFSKLAELSLSRLLAAGPSLVFEISLVAICKCLTLYGLIFLLLLANSLRQVHMARPVELLRAPNFGERPPRANWLLAVLGLVLLAAAYWLAATIKDPIVALLLFFGAAIMVIIATYLLFMAGSVALCRLLQKNKKFYYQTRHFVATGNMLFRMRRNGAGLASICILSTMVLVMISTTGCLFWGKDAALLQRYPQDMIFSVHNLYDPDNEDGSYYANRRQAAETYRGLIDAELAARGWRADNRLDFEYLEVAAFECEGELTFEAPGNEFAEMLQMPDITEVRFITVADYNKNFGMELQLAPDEVYVGENSRFPYTWLNLSFPQVEALPNYRVMGALPGLDGVLGSSEAVGRSLWVVLPDIADMQEICRVQRQVYDYYSFINWYYAFDLPAELKDDSEQSMDLVRSVWGQIEEMEQAAKAAGGDAPPPFHYDVRSAEKDWFFSMNSGLFFLAIVLALVFVAGALLIMYYKQLIEGYEDQAAFGILRKLGMTAREIRRSVNWQTLILFFLPLLMAGLHLVFAFPMLSLLIIPFGITDMALLTKICVCCYGAFALFYVLAYLITARLYYRIVTA